MISRKQTLLAAGSVFCIGVGLGIAWNLGVIPVEYRAAPMGALEATASPIPEESLLEDEPTTEEPDEAVPLWVEEQSEPPIVIGENLRAEIAAKSTTRLGASGVNARAVRPAKYEAEKTPQDAENENPESPARAIPDEPARALESALESDRFAEVDALLGQGEVLAAHKALSKLYWNSDGRDAELQDRLDETAKKIFFSPQPHFLEPYVVQPGDQLRKIAAKYNLSWEFLASLNRIDPKRLRAGQKLKVLKGPLSAIVNLQDFSLTVHLQGYYVRRYPVGIGK
jgi:LysM repeat protein